MKSFLASRTLWFNVVGGGLGVFLTALEGSGIDGQLVAIILMAGNVVLRFLTSKPISLTG